ncbi:hypothetical protein V7S43_006630 [Phytophthora oleae]|uniref:PiggyBac transposable element-derived protein domain-containing protein n=1 Tax=Phytophthora oleae TaxID=2107226 RepID=A0ABD3FQ71_9STRA
MAIVNVFIVYREAQKQRGEAPADHAEFLQILQAQLLQTTRADFAACCFQRYNSPGTTPSRLGGVIPETHKLSEFPEWNEIRERIRKWPQHQCKVCSIRKTKVGERSATRFFCEAYSDGNKRVYLCDRVSPNRYPNNNMTCHQIWHLKWKNGEERPRPRVGRAIQMRGLGKKRRRRFPVDDDGEDDDDAEDEEDAEGVHGSGGAGKEEEAVDTSEGIVI